MATYPTIPSQPPLEVDVKVSLNGDHITPVSFGPSITYEFPEPFTTDKISEIVVGELPMNFTRLRGMFGANTVSVSRSVTGSGLTNFEDTNTSSSSQVGFSSPFVSEYLYSTSGNPNQPTGVLKYDHGSPHVWDQPGNSLYLPVVDFFPRYNQWFAAATWPYPYDVSKALVPDYYKIYLIYIDKVAKQVYWREARAKMSVVDLPGVQPRAISIDSASFTQYPRPELPSYNNYDYSITVTVPTAGVYTCKLVAYPSVNDFLGQRASWVLLINERLVATTPGQLSLTGTLRGINPPGGGFPLYDQNIVGAPVYLEVSTEEPSSSVKDELWFTVT